LTQAHKNYQRRRGIKAQL